jgi:hypothetical protein
MEIFVLDVRRQSPARNAVFAVLVTSASVLVLGAGLSAPAGRGGPDDPSDSANCALDRFPSGRTPATLVGRGPDLDPRYHTSYPLRFSIGNEPTFPLTIIDCGGDAYFAVESPSTHIDGRLVYTPVSGGGSSGLAVPDGG